MRWCAGVLLAAVMAVPAAAATLTLSANGPVPEIAPNTQQAPIEVSVRMDCQDVLLRTHGAVLASGLEVQIASSAPPYVTLTGPQALTLPAEPCRSPGAATTEANRTFTAAVSAQAPGRVPLAVNFTATVAEDPQAAGLAPAESDSKSITVQAAPLLMLTAETANSILELTRPDSTFSLQVENLGNVPTRLVATFAVSAPPAHTAVAGVHVQAPDLVLGTPTRPGSLPVKADLVLHLHAEGAALPLQFVVQVRLEPQAAEGTAPPGNGIVVNFLFRNNLSAGKASPMPTAPLAGALLLALALPRRRP
jgi:hypothetical protein